MAFIIMVKIVPRAKKTVCILDSNKQLKCYIKSLPEGGKANKELLDYLASCLHLPKNKVSIATGFTSSTKRILIDDQISEQDLYAALGIVIQHSFLE